MAISDVFFRPSFLTLIFFVVLYAVYSRVKRNQRIPKGLPWGYQDERVKSASSVQEKLLRLKELYSDKGQTYIFKSTGQDPIVILPPSKINWIITQPESILSAQEMHREQLQSDWTFLNQNIVKFPIHQDAIRGNMVRKLDSFTQPVMDELRQCFEDYWGSSTEWHEVNIWDSMMKVFARTSNRMFVGLPLCRNEEFLDGCRGFAQDVMVSTAILNFMPAWLKPVLGYLAIAPNYWHYRKSAKHLFPLIESRLQLLEGSAEKDPADLLPNDLVTWSIIEALKSPDPRERTLELLAKRIMTVNMAAIHTSTMTSTNLLVDLLTSDPSYLQALTSEIEGIGATNDGDWSKSTLAAMTRTDSALRESMRVSGFVVWGVERKVVAKDGVMLPEGTKVPCGANIAVAAWDNHHDEKTYPKPFEYDALRFSRQREQMGGQQVHVGEEGLVEGEQGYQGGVASEKDLSKVLEGKNLSTVTTGSHFMQFGHGKFSCPGRFFAVQEIKLLMAQLLLNYEVQPIESRPQVKWLGTVRLPNTSTRIRVRRKLNATALGRRGNMQG